MSIWQPEETEDARELPSPIRAIKLDRKQWSKLALIKNITFKGQNRTNADWADFIDLLWDHRAAIIALLRGEI